MQTYDPTKHKELFFVEFKLDGIHLRIKKGTAFFKGGITNVWATLPEHIQKQAKDFWVEGELCIPNGHASDAMKKENRDWLEFIAYQIEGEENPRIVNETLHKKGFLVPAVLGIFHNPTLAFLDQKARELKIEGFVLKASDWYKFKVENTCDLKVTGIKLGEGKYTGHCGALLCSDKNGEVASVGGMTDEIRFKISYFDIGRIVEVKYQEIGSQGRLRHPRFVRWRDDKKKPDDLQAI
jgi:hypothetical protein